MNCSYASVCIFVCFCMFAASIEDPTGCCCSLRDWCCSCGFGTKKLAIHVWVVKYRNLNKLYNIYCIRYTVYTVCVYIYIKANQRSMAWFSAAKSASRKAPKVLLVVVTPSIYIYFSPQHCLTYCSCLIVNEAIFIIFWPHCGINYTHWIIHDDGNNRKKLFVLLYKTQP